MEYNALKAAIPAPWRKAVKKMKIPNQAISNKESAFVTCNDRTLALSIAENKDVYWDFVTKKITEPIVAHKWCTAFKIEKAEWTSLFTNYAKINDTKLKAFQFKILYNLIPCNQYLKRIKRSDTDKCPTCNLLDDITHYLIECSSTLIIWQQLTRWWQGVTHQEVNLTTKDIVVGLTRRINKIEMKDQLEEIIMTTKWTIHANKQLKETTCFYQVLLNIKKMLQIQKFIATKNNTPEKYETKWGSIEDYLT
jgi:hypothetical protein